VIEDDRLARAMAEYQAGDPSGFDRVYAGLEPVLRRSLGGMARDDARVEDLVQETFLQIHRTRHTFDPERPLVPWALSIARHVFLMDCRTRRRKGEFERVDLEDTTAANEARHDDALVARSLLDRGLEALNSGMRKAVVLHHVDGWSFDEIARRMGINNAAARLRASRGLNVLRRRLRGEQAHK
jgi:RNA polymerase sigma-70 factor (ECF subfamily)